MVFATFFFRFFTRFLCEYKYAQYRSPREVRSQSYIAVFETYGTPLVRLIYPAISSGFHFASSFSMMNDLSDGTLSIFDHSSLRIRLRNRAFTSAFSGSYAPATLFSLISYEMVFGLLPRLFPIDRCEYPFPNKIPISKRSALVKSPFVSMPSSLPSVLTHSGMRA